MRLLPLHRNISLFTLKRKISGSDGREIAEVSQALDPRGFDGGRRRRYFHRRYADRRRADGRRADGRGTDENPGHPPLQDQPVAVSASETVQQRAEERHSAAVEIMRDHELESRPSLNYRTLAKFKVTAQERELKNFAAK